jgi:hypothetical protein
MSFNKAIVLTRDMHLTDSTGQPCATEDRFDLSRTLGGTVVVDPREDLAFEFSCWPAK